MKILLWAFLTKIVFVKAMLTRDWWDGTLGHILCKKYQFVYPMCIGIINSYECRIYIWLEYF